MKNAKMKSRISVFVAFFALFAMANVYAQKSDSTLKHSFTLPSTAGDKLLEQCSRSVPKKVERYFEPTSENVRLLESNFSKVLTLKSTECCSSGGQVKTLDNFAFQYIGVVVDGKKYIYINAFRLSRGFIGPEEKLATEPIIVCDGGELFWGVLFDLELAQFSHLAFNGAI